MDIDQARTFFAITANGSFLEAARQLHLTQSTVSARIRQLHGARFESTSSGNHLENHGSFLECGYQIAEC